MVMQWGSNPLQLYSLSTISWIYENWLHM